MDKKEQRRILVDMMKADEADGLYEGKTLHEKTDALTSDQKWPAWSEWMVNRLLRWRDNPPTKDRPEDDISMREARAELRTVMEAHGWDIYGGSPEVEHMNYAWQAGFLAAVTRKSK